MHAQFSRIKIVTRQFHIDDYEGNTGIGYYVIIGWYLMVQPGIISNFKYNFFEWDGATLTTKEPYNVPSKPNITNFKMWETVIKGLILVGMVRNVKVDMIEIIEYIVNQRKILEM